MRRIFDRMFKTILAFALIFTSMVFVTPVHAAEEVKYEIYPTPHKISYASGSFVMRKEINVVFDSKVDEATRNHLTTVLKSKDKNITVSKEKVAGKTNVLVGIYNSKEYVDTYAKGTYQYNADLFNHFGAYYFTSAQDEIVIVGRDSDAAFYGITSLKQIFNQIDGSEIRHLTMEDYADVNIRGFIEGYYGIPWSNEDRMELMKFGSDFKMTSYIFAPKDDPYHKEKWREKYPAEELAKLKKMVDVGNETKCRFVWTAHPFMGGFNRNEADKEIKTLIAKFEHLYNDANVRQFGVLGDDVGGLPRSIVVKMMQEVGKWAESKGDVKDVVFCPGGYNHSWQGDYSELNEYDAGFPKNVQIFWTGEAVCQPIEQKTLEHFRRHNSSHHGERRAPLFWLNWPVNDINHSRMLMGDGSKMLHTNININDLAGAVTNPMQESEPSKVAIFQVADYAWNVKGFNGNKAWKDSFKYIDADAASEMYELAKHMANPEPNGHGLVMPESVEIAPKIKAFKDAMNAGKLSNEQIQSMIAEFETIINACDGFNTKSKNKEMKKDLAPYIASLKDLSEAVVKFLESKQSLNTGDKMAAFNAYTAGQKELKASETHTKPMLGGKTEVVDPGSTELIPFAKYLEKQLSSPMNDYVTGGTQPDKVTLTAETNINGIYAGTINNIIDGKDNTHMWSNYGEKVGDYFQVNFSKPHTIYGVHILNGSAEKNKQRDTFGNGQVKIKVNGEWQNLGDEFTDYPEFVDISQIEKENVEAVRYECVKVGSGNKWAAMREFRVSLEPEKIIDFTTSPLKPLPEGWSASDEELAKMVDGDINSLVHFNVRQHVGPESERNTYKIGDFYGVQFNKVITLGKIDILQGNDSNDNDMFHKSKLQYLAEDGKWKDIPQASFLKKNHIVFDASDANLKAKSVRLVATDSNKFWVRVKEFNVTAKQLFNSTAYTNVEALKTVKANVLTENASLQPKTGITLKPGEFIGIKLDRVHEISSIVNTSHQNLTLEVGRNEQEMTNYTNGTINARYIRLINKTENVITFDLTELSTSHNEVYPKSFLQSESKGFKIQSDTKPLSVFDGDWTTNTQFEGSQHQGNKFVYDLGQVIDLEQLKIVCRDSEHDFPRHAKFSVSTDLKNWEDVMIIGKQDGDYDGEATDQDNINNVLPNHETSYNTLEVKDINKKVRYLKFEITRDKAGTDKWVRFQEIILNNGAYIPSVNDPTFESDCTDTLGGEYAKLVDGDLGTHFIPNANKGYLTYHVTDKNDKNVVKIVQSASTISNAEVIARVMTNARTLSELKLGKLSQTVNEFVLPKGTILLDVKLTWDSKTAPMITELLLSSKEQSNAVNKDALAKLLTSKENTDNWTKASKAAYDEAIFNGSGVNGSKYVSQESVDGAVKAIQVAINNKQIKGDISKLQKLLEDKRTDVQSYTVTSWRAYQVAVSQLQAAIDNADNTSEKEVEKLVTLYNEAFNGLSYSPLKGEEAKYLVDDIRQLIESIDKPSHYYTSASWQLLMDVYEELKKTMETPIEDIHPSTLQVINNKVSEAKAALVNVENLVAAITLFDQTDSSIYTASTYEQYKVAVNHARALLENGSRDEVTKALSDIHNAYEQLVVKADLDSLKALIDELSTLKAEHYTVTTYSSLQKVLNDVKGYDLDKLPQSEFLKIVNLVQNAKVQLVNVEVLTQAIARGEKVDAKDYTLNSYKVLADALKVANDLLSNGTKDQVANQVNVIDNAIRELKTRMSKDVIDAYIKDIVFIKDKDAYTKASYDAYVKAYNHLIALSKDSDNVSKEAFYQAVEAFENATKALVKVEAQSPNNQTQGQVNTSDQVVVLPYIILGLLSLGVLAYTYNRKRFMKR